MSGLLEQIDLDCMRPYVNRDFSADAVRVLANNTAHYFAQQGIIDIGELLRLKELIDSPDIENTIVAFSVLEEKNKLSTQNSTQHDCSNIQDRES